MCTVDLVSWSPPLAPPLLSFYLLLGTPSLSLSWLSLLCVQPCSLSPVFFHFRPHFRVLYSCLSFSCFLFSFSLRGKAAQETPLPPALEGKISPRRQILSLVCWKPVGRFFHHRSGTPQAVGHTSGSAEMSVRSLLFISIHSVWNTLGASLDPLLT